MPWKLTMEGIPANWLEGQEAIAWNYLSNEGVEDSYAITTDDGVLTVVGSHALYLADMTARLCNGMTFTALHITETEG